VINTLVLYNAFGAPYCKPSVFMHNFPNLHLLQFRPLGPVSVVLQGLVQWHGETVARTALASPYPP